MKILAILLFVCFTCNICNIAFADPVVPATTPPNSCEYLKGRYDELKDVLKDKKEAGIIARNIPNKWMQMAVKLLVPIILGIVAGRNAD